MDSQSTKCFVDVCYRLNDGTEKYFLKLNVIDENSEPTSYNKIFWSWMLLVNSLDTEIGLEDKIRWERDDKPIIGDHFDKKKIMINDGINEPHSTWYSLIDTSKIKKIIFYLCPEKHKKDTETTFSDRYHIYRNKYFQNYQPEKYNPCLRISIYLKRQKGIKKLFSLEEIDRMHEEYLQIENM